MRVPAKRDGARGWGVTLIGCPEGDGWGGWGKGDSCRNPTGGLGLVCSLGRGQSYRQVLAATDAFLQDLAARRNGTRVLLIAHSANRWALDCLLTGASLEDLVTAPPAWRPGRRYTLPADWTATTR